MSLDKSIKHGKEKRKKYRGAKAIDCTCRNHNSCSWCRETRLHANKRRKAESEYECDDCFDTGCVCGRNCNGCCHCATAHDQNDLG